MLYVVTLAVGSRVLVPGRSPNHAAQKVAERLNTRVTEVDLLEAALYSDFEGMAYIFDLPIGDSP